MPDFETQIEQYFESLELLCSGYTFKQPLQLEVLTKLLNELSPKLKSYHSLYPDKKIRETPGDQLSNFLQTINIFMTKANTDFTMNLLDLLELINKKCFQGLTNDQTQTEILDLADKIALPDFDYNFVRFFHSQILQRWIASEDNYFDQFLADIQKIEEIIPLLKDLFSELQLTQIRSPTVKELDKSIGNIIDQIERRLLIIPVHISDKLKTFLVEYLTLIHKFRDVIQLQYHLSSLTDDLLNKGLLFTNEFSGICKNQITLIRDLKKKIDQNEDVFSKYDINEEIYNKTVTDLEQMIFSHNNMLDVLNKTKIQQEITVDVLISEEIQFIELLKNNLNFFVPEIKQIFLSYSSSMLYLIEWWRNTKKSLLQQSQLFELMFESVQETDKIQTVKKIKRIYFKSLFNEKKLFFSFIEETTDDLLPIFDHFTVINKSIFNALQDITKWDLLLKVDPIKNSISILDAIVQFFNRWNEENLKLSFEEKLKTYNTEFKAFFETFTKISSIFSEIQPKRFSNPKESLEKLNNLKKLVKDSENTIYNLFSTNLEVMNYIDKLTNDFETLSLIIIHFDTINLELLEKLATTWDTLTIKPFLKIMNEKIDLFPVIKVNFPNTEKLKVLTLFNFLISLGKIEDYLNDSMISSIMEIDSFNGILSELTKSKDTLLNLQSLFPSTKKDKLDIFYKDVNQFFDIIAISWLNLAKKTKKFVDLQSKRISISDRKDLYNNFIDYQGIVVQFNFKWPIFENKFKSYDTIFYPKFKSYFYNLISFEDQWQQIINRMTNNAKIDVNKKELVKKIDYFISEKLLEDFSTDFFSKIADLMRERKTYINNEPLPSEKMKQLII